MRCLTFIPIFTLALSSVSAYTKQATIERRADLAAAAAPAGVPAGPGIGGLAGAATGAGTAAGAAEGLDDTGGFDDFGEVATGAGGVGVVAPAAVGVGVPGGVLGGIAAPAVAGVPGGVPGGVAAPAVAGVPGGVPGGVAAPAVAGVPGGVPGGVAAPLAAGVSGAGVPVAAGGVGVPATAGVAGGVAGAGVGAAAGLTGAGALAAGGLAAGVGTPGTAAGLNAATETVEDGTGEVDDLEGAAAGEEKAGAGAGAGAGDIIDTSDLVEVGYSCGTTYYKKSRVEKTVKKACEKANSKSLLKLGSLRFPKEYDPKDDSSEFSGVPGKQYMFPILKDDTYDIGDRAYHDRVVINKNCKLGGLVRENKKFEISGSGIDKETNFKKCIKMYAKKEDVGPKSKAVAKGEAGSVESDVGAAEE